ncbi:DUF3320 domain-containing protein [Streptomyces sp. FT05W]|nr:DUF3320 domain-containing protein [Streptomyces sp. FT05W]PWS50231.1 DUF3320 domain-containing protein [Streptomyces sp. FT05W]
MTIPGTFGGGTDLERLKQVLAVWRTSLVDLSGRNRLLNFRHTKSATLEITQPPAELLVRGLDRGWDFAPLPDEELEGEEAGSAEDGTASRRLAEIRGSADGIVTQKTTGPALRRALTGLRSRSTQIFNDYGLWTLQLGVGVLHWREDGAETGSDAPLVLVPARVTRMSNGRMRLELNEDEEPRLNPALRVKLEQFHIDWAPVTEQDPTDLAAVLAAVTESVAGKSGWKVSRRVVLALFASHKESMYQDLLENESRVLASDLVKAVALGPNAGLASDRFDFEEIELDRIDQLSPPEDSPLVLDADASQRQAVAAAVAGQSFVLDGPPGTGKSQTITNMIAGLIHAGRSVLFVSEKAAALDVVLDRLRSVGLDSYALPLHSHNTSRRAVAQELGRALEEEPQAPQLSQQAVALARETRQALSGYADAMNEVCEPLGKTLHDVIGRVGRLSDAPVAYLTPAAGGGKDDKPFVAATLSSQDLHLVIEATQAIADAWQAVADPSFPWRDLRAGTPHPRPALDQAMAALEGLVTAVARYPELGPGGSPAGDESGVVRLTGLLSLIESRHDVPEHWLTTPDFAETVDNPVDAFLTELRKANRAAASARSAAGARWEELSARLTAEKSAAESTLAGLAPPGIDLSPLTEERAGQLAREFEATADGLDRTHGHLSDLARRFGLDVPRDTEAATQVCDVVALAGSGHRPLGSWFEPGGAARADQAAVRVIADRLRAFFAHRDGVLSARAEATALAGPGWADLPIGLSADPSPAEQALADLDPAGLDITSCTRRYAAENLDRFSALAETLESAERHAESASALLGLDRPRSTAGAEDLVALIDLTTAPHRAPATWHDPAVLLRVQDAVADITEAADRLADAERSARDTFRHETLSTPGLPDLIRRLTEGSRGIGGLLSSGIRADRKAVAGITVTGSWRSDLYDKLPSALAWHSAHDRLKQLTLGHRELLGVYATSELPDVPALQAAVAHAESVHRLAQDAVLTPHRRTTLAAQTADGGTPSPELLGLGAALRDELDSWTAQLNDPSLRSDADELIKQPLGSAVRRLRAHLDPLREAIALLDTLTAVGRRAEGASERTVSVARGAVAAAHRARRETESFAAQEATHRRLLGPWYRGLDTDPSRFRDDDHGDSTGHEATGQLLRLAWEASEPAGAAGPAQFARATEHDIELLGRYAPDGHPDSDLLRRSIEAARTVEKLALAALADPVRRTRLADGMTDGTPVPHEALRQAEQIRSELEIWQRHVRLPHLSAAGNQLLHLPLDEAARWFRVHVEPFEDAVDLVHSVARVADTTENLTLGRAREAVTAVVQARAAAAGFTEHASAHRDLLGELYRSTATDRSDVLDALDWAQKVRRSSDGSYSAPLTQAAAHTMLTAPADPSVAQRHEDWRRQRDALADHFQPPRDRALRRELQQSLSAARAYLSRLDDDPYGPEAWTSCAQALTRLRGYGLDGLPGQLAQRDVSAADFPAAMERAVLTAWIERRFELDARLLPMRAVERDQLVERFRTADRDLVQAAHADVIAACNDRRPRRTSVGQAAVLRRQAQLKTRHMPVRRLLGETREVVRLIKPCFMMSPLTVSQFLPSDFRFDVVIFDEASQVLPQDAVNSIYRGDALIVAGDQKQLPPTSFFSAGGGGDEDDEWDEDGAAGFESVLDACKATGVLRGLPLRWHYRSRHENLIAFSNHEFYENTMVTFPGALEQSPDVGVEFIKADGVYDKGGRSNNPLEAARVAQRVIHHFATRPGLTLGVVALSKAQAEAVEEAVQKARTARPDLDRFFTDDRLDGFFVKNLETVQGDERDVIILSVGYGPDQQGKLASSFGPINREGGWRRLNVAVTRARRRMEVVASFYGGDLRDSPNKSVQHLKRYLQYAQHGPQVLETHTADPEAAPESPFEEEVLDVLRDWGYSVQPQVGVAGFRIDMAVRHPAAPGSYALGIECDGAMYHSSRAARDRDRLRESVLRDLGWKLHRIWGTDWYRSRRDAMARLRAAVEAACAQDPHGSRPEPEPVPVVVEEAPGALADTVPAAAAPSAATARTVTIVPVDDAPAPWSRPYQEAEEAELDKLRKASARRRDRVGIELQDPDAGGVVGDVVRCVIEVEGPVTEELIFTRVRSAWGLARSGQVIQDRIRRVLRKLVTKGEILRVGDAYDRPGHEVEVARTPTSRFTRKVTQVPSVERQLALRSVVEESPGVQRAELLREVARFFGWARLGSDIRDALTDDIDDLVATGALDETDGGLLPVDGG